MADVGDNNFMRYIYRGEEGEVIPREATHITVAEGVTFVRAQAFEEHRKIVEVICHDKVEKIEEEAFRCCPNLRRVIMLGVKIVEMMAFEDCDALTDVECSKLEIIGSEAFSDCSSLRRINLLSVRIFEAYSFDGCKALKDAEFGSRLERIEEKVFGDCFSLERIAIPLKDGLITADSIFVECENLRHVDLVDGAVLQETVASLQLEEWRNDMNGVIDSINQILPKASAGHYDEEEEEWIAGEKAQVIRTWIRSVIDKMNHYKAEHESFLNEAAATLQFALPQDLVMNNVVSFVALPSHTFEVEE